MEAIERKTNRCWEEGAALTQDPAPAAEPAVCPGPGLGDCSQAPGYMEAISEKSKNVLLLILSTITASYCHQGA